MLTERIASKFGGTMGSVSCIDAFTSRGKDMPYFDCGWRRKEESWTTCLAVVEVTLSELTHLPMEQSSILGIWNFSFYIELALQILVPSLLLKYVVHCKGWTVWVIPIWTKYGGNYLEIALFKIHLKKRQCSPSYGQEVSSTSIIWIWGNLGFCYESSH
jgi:hypothetical protein